MTLALLIGVGTAGGAPASAVAPRLRSLLRQARLVVAGVVLQVREYDSGRVAVIRLRAVEKLKGSANRATVAIVATNDTPRPQETALALVFLEPGRRNSYLAETLPPGNYYRVADQRAGWLVAGSRAELAEMTDIVGRLVAASREPERDAAKRAVAARDLAFQLLGAAHPALVADGAASLGSLPDLAATLTAGEQQRLDTVLRRADLPHHVRLALIGAVAENGLTQLIPTLRDLRDPALQEASSQALRKLGAPLTTAQLGERLVDPDPVVRSAAVRDLLRGAGVEAISRAAPLALRDPDTSVRLAAIEALGQTGAPPALPSLEQVFAAPDIELRQAATRAILAIGGDPAADSFARLAFSGPVAAQRLAVFALMATGVEKDDPRVQRIAREHPDEKIRDMLTRGISSAHQH